MSAREVGQSFRSGKLSPSLRNDVLVLREQGGTPLVDPTCILR